MAFIPGFNLGWGICHYQVHPKANPAEAWYTPVEFFAIVLKAQTLMGTVTY